MFKQERQRTMYTALKCSLYQFGLYYSINAILLEYNFHKKTMLPVTFEWFRFRLKINIYSDLRIICLVFMFES